MRIYPPLFCPFVAMPCCGHGVSSRSAEALRVYFNINCCQVMLGLPNPELIQIRF